MIRINLIPQRRPKSSDQGQQSLLLGLLMIIVVGALVYFLVHQQTRREVVELREVVQRLEADNRDKAKPLKNTKQLKQTNEEIKKRSAVIERLNDARALPAHMLYELSNVLTANGAPTMTTRTIAEMKRNPNREPNREWDATHVWLTEFKEKKGAFTLTGGAQSDTDITQLALRLEASVYFHDVIPAGAVVATDKNSGITYYQFTISGRVAY